MQLIERSICIMMLVSVAGFLQSDANASDISTYLKMGCKPVQAENKTYIDCTAAGLEKTYSCLEFREVPEYFGSLSPTVPILECLFAPETLPPDSKEYVLHKGCGMLPLYNRYLVYHKEQIHELKNKSDVKRFFYPIDSPEEALAIAALLTESFPLYRVDIPPGYIKMTDKIVPSYAKKTGANFLVRLFDYQCGGCGNHPYFFVNYEVTAEGDLNELSREDVYRDPKEDNRCQD